MPAQEIETFVGWETTPAKAADKAQAAMNEWVAKTPLYDPHIHVNAYAYQAGNGEGQWYFVHIVTVAYSPMIAV